MFLEHDGKTVLVQGSAGFEKGALIGHHADVVFLSIATLGKLEQGYQEDYWREVVEAVKPGRIIPINWDDFHCRSISRLYLCRVQSTILISRWNFFSSKKEKRKLI